MKSKFFKKLNNCSKYIEFQNFPKFLEWLECKVMDATSNLMQWFDVFYPTKDRANWTMEVVELWDNVTWWAKFNNNFWKKRHNQHHGRRKGLKMFFPK
jgi:hypothetical protein